MRKLLGLLAVLLIDQAIDAQQIDPPVPCRTDQDCSMLAENQKEPTCKGGFCACTIDQKIVNCSSPQTAPHREKLISSVLIPQCKHEVDCNSLGNSFCNTVLGQCQCYANYVFSKDRTRCLPVARSISFPCVEDRQCLEFLANTTCQDQQCICVTGYHAINNDCWKMAPFGGPCTKSEECYHINGAVCTDKKICGCKEGTVIDEMRINCVIIATKIGDECTTNGDCSRSVKNATCIDGKCQCKMGNHFAEEINGCVVDRDIDEPCRHNYDCYHIVNDTNTNVLQCFNSMCDCKDNYHRNGNDCTSAGARTIGSTLVILWSFFITVYHFL